jgi:hypothetical protein
MLEFACLMTHLITMYRDGEQRSRPSSKLAFSSPIRPDFDDWSTVGL